MKKVYVAGGWFDDEQYERVYAVRDIIENAKFSTFFPKEESLVSSDSDLDFRESTFKGNIDAIKDSEFMVCITDKKDIGTIFEAGVAYAMSVPIVYFAETLGDNPFNLMLAQSGIRVAKSREELAEILEDIYNNGISSESFIGKVE